MEWNREVFVKIIFYAREKNLRARKGPDNAKDGLYMAGDMENKALKLLYSLHKEN